MLEPSRATSEVNTATIDGGEAGSTAPSAGTDLNRNTWADAGAEAAGAPIRMTGRIIAMRRQRLRIVVSVLDRTNGAVPSVLTNSTPAATQRFRRTLVRARCLAGGNRK